MRRRSRKWCTVSTCRHEGEWPVLQRWSHLPHDGQGAGTAPLSPSLLRNGLLCPEPAKVRSFGLGTTIIKRLCFLPSSYSAYYLEPPARLCGRAYFFVCFFFFWQNTFPAAAWLTLYPGVLEVSCLILLGKQQAQSSAFESPRTPY